ncbi:MAG TPA: hypothetical protein VN441_15150 [Syntrophomonas sp.]|nr:hypothetical protein [Syntrophomonas sp.]
MKENFAKFIRIVSVPPVLVTALIVILAVARDDVFTSTIDIVMALIFLALIPVIAYPLSVLIPEIKEKGREGQRNLAFILTAVGYVIVWLYGLLSACNQNLQLLFTSYLLSVVILLILNKLLKIRASGHGCSITGPIVLVSYFLGFQGFVVGCVAYALIFWASIRTKRHTPQEFIFGTATSLVSFTLTLLVIM